MKTVAKISKPKCKQRQSRGSGGSRKINGRSRNEQLRRDEIGIWRGGGAAAKSEKRESGWRK